MTDVVSDVQAAIDAGVASAEPKPLERGTLYSVALPGYGTHEVVDTEQYSARPWRSRAKYRPATVDALILLIERFTDPDNTTIWVHPSSGRIVAIFNDDDAENPGWRDHRAELQLQHTLEWKHWESQDGRWLTQHAFAEHVEEGLAEIREPAAADMLELAQTVEATQGANFRSAIRLDNGQVQARYEETIDTKAGQSGQLTIPSEFKLGVAPFLGEAAYGLTARFRYRVASGNLSMGYKLDRPDAAVRDALDKIADKLSERFSDLPVVIGEP